MSINDLAQGLRALLAESGLGIPAPVRRRLEALATAATSAEDVSPNCRRRCPRCGAAGVGPSCPGPGLSVTGRLC